MAFVATVTRRGLKSCVSDYYRVGVISSRELVTQITPTTSLLRADGSDNEVYLVGTAHVSEASAKEVQDLIVNIVKPETVFVELDAARAAKLVNDNPLFGQDDDGDLLWNNIRSKVTQNLPMAMMGGKESVMADYIRSFYNMLKGYGLVPGIDMLSAIRAAHQIDARLYYGDQDSNATMRKLTSGVSNPMTLMKAMGTPVPEELQEVFQKIMAGGLDNIGVSVERMKQRHHARKMGQFLDSALPEVANALLHERDLIMANNLRAHCGKGKVVAVVGMAHMDGIEQHWTKLGKSSQ